MRFCKFVPLDTFSIIQSLRKTSGTSITPLAHCLDPENNLSHLLTLREKGSPAAFYLEGSPHPKPLFGMVPSPYEPKSIEDSTPVAKLVLPKDTELSSLSLTLPGKDHTYKAIGWGQGYLTTSWAHQPCC